MGGFTIKNNSVQLYFPGDDFKDYSGNGYDGTVSGTTSIGIPTGERASEFNGSSDDVSTSAPSTNNITAAAWVNCVASPDDVGQFVALDDGSGGDRSFQLRTSTGNIFQFVIFVGATSYVVEDTEARAGSWHHVAGTYDGSTCILYVDGEAVDTDSTMSGNLDTKTGIEAGARDNGTDDFLEGSLSNPVVWSRALPAEEIKHIYKKTYRS